MRKITYLGLALMLGLVAAIGPSSAATARPVWKLPMAASVHGGRVYTSVAWHCGRNPFGQYRFRHGIMLSNGRSGYVEFKVRIAANGSRHRPKRRRFRGNLPAKVRRQTRYVIRHTAYRYNRRRSVVESRWLNGRLQATRAFNPVRARRARC